MKRPVTWVLGAFGAVALVVSVWLLWPRPSAVPTRVVPGSGDVPPPDGPAGRAPAPAGSREEALDQVEAAEAETYGAAEAARRRAQRERMLDLRAEEH